MEQPEQYQLTQMVNHTMVFIARCFLIPATLQFVVITRYYASLRLAGNKNQRTLNPIQLRFLGLNNSDAQKNTTTIKHRRIVIIFILFCGHLNC
jgi:hypothetical protein